MRFIPAFLGALFITAMVFLFMQGLIEGRQKEGVKLLVHEPVEVFQKKQVEKEAEQPPEEQQEPEPVMKELQLPVFSPQPSVELEIAMPDLATGDLAIAATGNRWSTPLGADAVGILDGRGIGGQGFVEVIPYSTRKPNVPELAWKNKINGWVLVAFNVTPNGRTQNIRVLDASPRGVFEEKVIAAVKDWMYAVKFLGTFKGDIVLTQKVEVEWKDFHMNVHHLDD